MQKSKYNKLLISIGICLCLTVVLIIMYYSSRSLGNIPGSLFILIYFSHLLLLFLGSVCLILRMFRFANLSDGVYRTLDSVNNPARTFYILIGTLNTWIGGMALILSLSGKADMAMIRELWPNLILGILLFGDSFILKSRSPQKS